MHPGKGLGTLVDAFLQLEIPGARLRIAGAVTGPDKRYVQSLQRKLGDRAEFLPNLDRAAKQDFLRSLSVFSVPATYGEAFGLYVIEALACGVPVVQPRHAAFPEVLEKTGGGLLCEPDNAVALAAALRELLFNPSRARQLGEAGRQVVRAEFSVDAMTQNTETIFRQVTNVA
jgi:glycosyltransferase involved in cell wall biosynthesis